MTENNRVVILGGHGKVAMLATPKFREAGYQVANVIRNPEQESEIKRVGGEPVLLDMEKAGVDDLAEVFQGAAAVVFSAGAGGGNPERTRAVDYEAAVRTMDAAEKAGVKRYVMVSYAGAQADIDRVDPEDSFYPYVQAKHNADQHLKGTGLDYTILGPGMLTLEPASGRITPVDEDGRIDGRGPEGEENHTARENVAEVMVHVIRENAAVRRVFNFFDGQTPISEVR